MIFFFFCARKYISLLDKANGKLLGLVDVYNHHALDVKVRCDMELGDGVLQSAYF